MSCKEKALDSEFLIECINFTNLNKNKKKSSVQEKEKCPVNNFDESLSIFSVNCQKSKSEENKKEEFTCPEGQGNGNFADPATCRRFYQARNRIVWKFSSKYLSKHWFFPFILKFSASMDILTWTGVLPDCISMTLANFVLLKMKLVADQFLRVSFSRFPKIFNSCLTSMKSYSFISFSAPAPITETPTDLAERCDPANCELPYCFCSRDGTFIPGGLLAEEVNITISLWQ